MIEQDVYRSREEKRSKPLLKHAGHISNQDSPNNHKDIYKKNRKCVSH